MGYASIEISLLALVPAVLLGVYIYKKDRVEKEPWWLLLLLLVLGAALYLPAVWAERSVAGLIDGWFAPYVQHGLTGMATFSSPWMRALHGTLCAFGGVGLLEELPKWLVLVLLTSRSRHFNSLFDGVVYASFVSLGFAAVENIRYAWIDGWDTLVLRAITSVPGHLFFGIVMGYCYTMWNKCRLANRMEKELLSSGAITRRRYVGSWLWLVASLVLPVLVHGLYLFICSYETPLAKALFYLLLLALYAVCFTAVNRLSDADGAVLGAAKAGLRKAHPQWAASSAEEAEKGGEADEQ